MLKFHSLFHFFLHVLHHHFWVQLSFSQLILCLNLQFFFLSLELFLISFFHILSVIIILVPVFFSHLFKLWLLLLQLHIQIALNLSLFGLFLFEESLPSVLYIDSELLVEFLLHAIEILISILFHLFDVLFKLLTCIFSLKKLVILYLFFLNVQGNFVIKSLFDSGQIFQVILLDLDFLIFKLL